jgi:hypothetical protein
MSRFALLLWLALSVSASGCAFHRADFVCGPNGTANQGDMSDTGKTVGSILRSGPHLSLNY